VEPPPAETTFEYIGIVHFETSFLNTSNIHAFDHQALLVSEYHTEFACDDDSIPFVQSFEPTLKLLINSISIRIQSMSDSGIPVSYFYMSQVVETSVSTLSDCKLALLLMATLLQHYCHMRFVQGDGRMRGCIDLKKLFAETFVVQFKFRLEVTGSSV
jgi:hypothetical protein